MIELTFAELILVKIKLNVKLFMFGAYM